VVQGLEEKIIWIESLLTFPILIWVLEFSQKKISNISPSKLLSLGEVSCPNKNGDFLVYFLLV
jgi:hypothetical protein